KPSSDSVDALDVPHDPGALGLLGLHHACAGRERHLAELACESANAGDLLAADHHERDHDAGKGGDVHALELERRCFHGWTVRRGPAVSSPGRGNFSDQVAGPKRSVIRSAFASAWASTLVALLSLLKAPFVAWLKSAKSAPSMIDPLIMPV